jgi:hypothetical protein
MTTRETTHRAERSWRRIERRAVRHHERDVLRTLCALSVAHTPVLTIEVEDGRVGSILGLSLPDHRLVMAPIAPGVARRLGRIGSALNAHATPALRASGRYGPQWWLAVAWGAHTVTVLGGQLHLTPRGGGLQDDFPDPWFTGQGACSLAAVI